MANTNSPFGLRPVRYLDGRPYNGAVDLYFATGATGAIRPGDPVVDSGSANTTEVNGFPPGSLPTCQIALDGTGDPIVGVCVGVLPDTRDSTIYRVTSTDRVIAVARGADLIFECQSDAGGTALAADDVGQNVVFSPGTTSTLWSDWTVSTGTAPNTTAGFQARLMGFSKNPKNEIGAYSVVEVLINNHTLGNVTDAGRSTPV